MPAAEGGYTVGKTKKKVSAGRPPAITPSAANRARRRTRIIDDETANRSMERRVGRPGGKVVQTLGDLGLLPDDDTGWYPTRIERIRGTDPRVRDVTDRIGRGDLPNDPVETLRRLLLENPDLEVDDNLLELGPKFDVAGGLMDLLQTPGFKIGLGGTAALMGVLSYLGANVAEEVLP